MALKRTTIEVSGQTFTLKELSMAAQLRLQEKEKKTPSDVYWECIEERAELERLSEQLPAKEWLRIINAINELNGWN